MHRRALLPNQTLRGRRAPVSVATDSTGHVGDEPSPCAMEAGGRRAVGPRLVCRTFGYRANLTENRARRHASEEVLERWLSAQNAPPRYESEAHLKIFFGDYGTKDELLANLHALAAEAGAIKALWRTIASEYDSGERAFPGRVHVNSLIYRWVWEQQELHERWARWAIERVESWPDAHGPTDDAQSLAVFRDALKSPPSSE